MIALSFTIFSVLFFMEEDVLDKVASCSSSSGGGGEGKTVALKRSSSLKSKLLKLPIWNTSSSSLNTGSGKSSLSDFFGGFFSPRLFSLNFH